MKRTRDIEMARLVAELQSAQSQLAFYKERAESSVPREKYDAVVAERDAVSCQLEDKDRQHADEITALKAKYEAELAAKEAELKEYRETQVLLQTENADSKTLWEFWQRHHFGASSETMTELMDQVVGQLPTGKMSMMADILDVVDRINRSGSDATLPAQEAPARNESKESGKKGEAGGAGRNCKRTKCLDVREILGPDFSDMPPGYKVIMRKGKAETFIMELLFMDKARTYSKKFTVVRCNVPGDDPRNSKYPPMLFGKVPVDPTFASFYLEMKYGYNIPESRILEMLAKAGCIIPQATLNRWMHKVMEGLSDALMEEMEKSVRESRFTHNDETRILVRSIKDGEDSPAYRTGYIHGILSPEASLFIMLYEKGSRGHEVQKRIFEDSDIMAFVADRCPMYLALMTALSLHPLIRGACWVHFRRYLMAAYLQDKRLEPMAHLLARLFAAEKIISDIRNLTETERVRERQRMCRPLVEAMFRFMEKVRAAGTDYGVLARRSADYLLDDREGFSAFLTCGLLEIQNNAVERCFRNMAKGRENWLQCGSHDAARHTAFMYSLVESCKMNGLDFGRYIETVLRRLLDGDKDYHGMLPNVITLAKATENTPAA